MSRRSYDRERTLWIALVSVLATALAWTATIAGLALVHFDTSSFAPAIAVARALVHVLLAVASHTWPLLPLAIVGGMMIALVLRRPGAIRERTHHA
jgi:hypothetical protein